MEVRGWEEALSEGSSLSCGQTVENSDEAELCVRACVCVECYFPKNLLNGFLRPSDGVRGPLSQH